MIPAAFDYGAPSTLDDAIALLQQRGDEARVLAGGHSLIPLMRLRLAKPTMLVDLCKIPDLAYIRDKGDHVAIGAMTTHHTVESSDLLRRRLPVLPLAAGMIGDTQVRNRGTIGGSLAHADPAGDMPSVVSALEGEMVARGPNGERIIPAQEFFQDVWTTSLQPGEILTEIRIPCSEGETAQAYEKFRVRSIDWALVGVAVNLTRSNGDVKRARVVLTNVGTTPVRARGAEESLERSPISNETLEVAAERASEGLNPSGELNASPDYKRHLAQVLTQRALESALGR
jgi:carbon-monoxide dehydrogenase medium subunit